MIALKEGIEGCVDLPEEDPEILQRALDYIYTGSYRLAPVSSCFMCASDTNATNSEETTLVAAFEQASLTSKEDGPKSRPSGGDVSHASYHKAVLHLEVFRCGDRLDAQALKTKSALMYLQSMEREKLYDDKDFAKLVDYTLRYTRSEDVPLILNLALHGKLLQGESEVKKILQERHPVQLEMALRNHRAWQAVFEERQQSELKAIAAKDGEIRSERYERLVERMKIDKLMEKYMNFNYCPGCGKANSLRFCRLTEPEDRRPSAPKRYKLQCEVSACQRQWTT